MTQISPILLSFYLQYIFSLQSEVQLCTYWVCSFIFILYCFVVWVKQWFLSRFRFSGPLQGQLVLHKHSKGYILVPGPRCAMWDHINTHIICKAESWLQKITSFYITYAQANFFLMILQTEYLLSVTYFQIFSHLFCKYPQTSRLVF